MNKTISIIGGTQESTMKALGQKKGFTILHHDAHVRGGGNKKTFQKMVKKSQCVIVLGACSHSSMWLIKDLCKKYNVPVEFLSGRGISGALQQASLLCR